MDTEGFCLPSISFKGSLGLRVHSCQEQHGNVTSSSPLHHHHHHHHLTAMTLHDSIPDGPASATPLSDAVLLARFRALSIDKSPDICEEDDILSDNKILVVYQSWFPHHPTTPPPLVLRFHFFTGRLTRALGLLVDLRALVIAVAANASLAETNLPALFQNVFFGVCRPFRL